MLQNIQARVESACGWQCFADVGLSVGDPAYETSTAAPGEVVDSTGDGGGTATDDSTAGPAEILDSSAVALALWVVFATH